ncbi:MAG: hypothetical protein KIT80_13245 [Chitinophagaceae bacterium]|nr:hypothetical protein [Chitinophagaceae bacterium]MCW5927873.1 hypothetical protein [Chitinophagaceae bacterium]
MKRRTVLKANLSFIFFIVIVIKDVLVSVFKVIPERSPANRLISWFIIVPLTVIGIIFSIQVIKTSFLQRKNKPIINKNVILSLPILFLGLYFLMMIFYMVIFQV